MSLVLDSSATLAWIYGDETTDPIRVVFDQVAEAGAVAPALCRLEVGNSLTDLALLDITIYQSTDSHAWGETLLLADRFRLTLYDAAYLELAQRLVFPLATLDGALCTAAATLGVRLLGGG